MSKYYHAIVPGKAFACNACGQVFDGPNCRNLAIRCHHSHEKQEPSTSHIAYQTRPKLEGESVAYPDSWGHFRRTDSNNPDHNALEYHRAHHRNDQEHQRHLKEIRALFKQAETWKKRISPLQRLAYAYHFGRWESVKQAAIAYGFSQAVTRYLDALDIPHVLRDLFHMDDLVQSITEDMEAGERTHFINTAEDFETRLRIEDLLTGRNADDTQA